MRHSRATLSSLCGTLLQDTLVGHSCRTLLWDTLCDLFPALHVYYKLPVLRPQPPEVALWTDYISTTKWPVLGLVATRGTQSRLPFQVCHQPGAALQRTLQIATSAGHSCGALLQDALVGQSEPRKSVPQERATRVPYKSVPQKCPTSVPQE